MSKKIVKGVAFYLGYEAVTLLLAYLLMPVGGAVGDIGFHVLGFAMVGVVGIPAAHLMWSDWMRGVNDRFAQRIADPIIRRREAQSAGA